MSKNWQYTYYVEYIEPQDDIILRNSRITALCNRLEVSRTKLLGMIFTRGLDALEEENEITGTDIAISKKLQEIRKNKERFNHMEEVYKDTSLNDFLAWCQESEIEQDSIDKFLYEYTWRTPEIRWDKRVLSWLGDFMKGKGEVVTQEIKIAAQEAEIIDDDPKSWERMRRLAQRYGYTQASSYGTWRERMSTDGSAGQQDRSMGQ